MDYRVTSRTNEEITAIANGSRPSFVRGVPRWVDIVACLESGWIETIKGRKRLVIEILDDVQMGGDDALTESSAHLVKMRFKASVYREAKQRVGRARFTLAHELGHAVLCHDKAPMARQTGTNSSTKKPEFIEKSRSAERQADKFASAFLIDEHFLSDYASPKELAVAHGVSLAAATIRFDRHTERKERVRTAKKISQMVEDFKASLSPKESLPHFADAACSQCGQRKLIPIGPKYLCQDCGTVADNLQDGDSAAL